MECMIPKVIQIVSRSALENTMNNSLNGSTQHSLEPTQILFKRNNLKSDNCVGPNNREGPNNRVGSNKRVGPNNRVSTNVIYAKKLISVQAIF